MFKCFHLLSSLIRLSLSFGRKWRDDLEALESLRFVYGAPMHVIDVDVPHGSIFVLHVEESILLLSTLLYSLDYVEPSPISI